MAHCCGTSPLPDGLCRVLKQNEEYARRLRETSPEVFQSMCAGQHPEYLWLGCSDSRVLANEVTGLGPGELFVHRNVGNLVQHSDLSCMCALEYAVQELKVKHIIVCGHYGCGAVKAALALPSKTLSIVNCWISPIRDTRNSYNSELQLLGDPQLQHDRLCELNVARQCYNVCTSPVVQAAWARGQRLSVHGVIYRLSDGILRPLVGPITCLADAPDVAPASAPAPARPATPAAAFPVGPRRTSPGRAAVNFSFVTPSLRPDIDAAVASSPPSSSSTTTTPSPTPSDYDSDTTASKDVSPAGSPIPPAGGPPAGFGAKRAPGAAEVEEVKGGYGGLQGLVGLADDLKAALDLHARYDAVAAAARSAG